MILSVFPVKSTPKMERFDLFESLKSDLEANDARPQTGDVVVISSKYVANSQGRIVEYDTVIPSPDAKSIALKFQIKPEMAEIILRESDVIFGGIPGFVITSS
ncbi:MAG: coenzyme F420-0:L-glutamate ligase, partial [Patescibacteria group bacterium]|nr:coenzyme F420-0:L-glutamate ligase [Patescibacteria group bacterium]